MHGPIVLEFQSDVAHDRDAVWDRVSTMHGVNAELGPFVRMTYPPALPSLNSVDLVAGEVQFKSWVLFLGVVPFDRHALAITSVTNGAGFVEDSTSWLQRRWRHERTLTDAGHGHCVVADRLTIEPRFAFTTPVVRAIVRAVFAHRHRRLRTR